MLSRGFVVLWIATLVAMAGIGMVSPLLPVYVRDDLNGPEIAVALSFSGLALTMLIAAPFVGRLGDRYGAKPFIAGGFIVYALGGFGYLWADHWEQVIALRMLSGLGAAAIFPMALTYVGRLAPTGREGTYMGTFSVAEIAGFGIGPLMGGALRDLAGSQTAFLVMALMLTVTGLLTFLLLPGQRTGRSPGQAEEFEGPALPWGDLLRRPIVQAAMSVQMVVALGWGAGSTFLAVYVISEDGLGTDSAILVGLLLGARSLLGALLQPAFGRLADSMNRLMLVTVGLSVAAVGQFIIPDLPAALRDVTLFGQTFVIAPWLLLLYLSVGVGEALAWPAQRAIFVAAGRRVGMGSIMGLNQMASSVGFLGGSVAGAGVVGLFGLEAVFRFAGVSVLLGVVIFVLLMRRAAHEIREAELPAPEMPAGVTAGD